MLNKASLGLGTIIATHTCEKCKGTKYQIKEEISSGMYASGYRWICPTCDHICKDCGQSLRKDEWCTGTMLHSSLVCTNEYCPSKITSIGVLGGTFNPIHNGHLRFAESLREAKRFSRILFVPAFDPPHKDGDIVSFDQRVQMIEAAIAGNPRFDVSRIEETLQGKSYSYNTVLKLKTDHPKVKFTFLTGMDSWTTFATWFKYTEILGLCDFVFTCDSPKELGLYWAYGPADIKRQLKDAGQDMFKHESGTNVEFMAIITPKVRSTDIRALVKDGKSCRYLIPEPVYELITKWKLYTKYSR